MGRGKSAADGLLQYESGRAYTAMAALTDQADGYTWAAAAGLWSGYSGCEPVVHPDGLVTGGVITPAASGTNNLVDISAATCYLAGVLTSVSAATDQAIARATPADTHKITSVIITAAGAFDVVAGADDTAFSETRAADGGPPLVTAGTIEVGQVRFSSSTAAAVEDSEIFQVPGTHQERTDYPVWDEDWADGEIVFTASISAIHVGPTRRKVYAAYYTPIFAEIQNASDFVPAEETHSVTSTQIYGGTVGARSSSLGQGSFSARLPSGTTHDLIKQKNKNLWFKFFEDKYASPYILTQGVLGINRQFPAGDNIIVNCTISADQVSIEKES